MTELHGAIDAYFAGERGAGLGLVLFGVVLLAAAIWVWRTESGGFATGMGVAMVVLGLLLAGGGSFLAWKTPAQVETLKEALEADPGVALTEERARMEKVNANWVRLKSAWAALALVGFALALWKGRDWTTGLALVLLVFSTAAMVLDTFAERRAEVYAAVLHSAGGAGLDAGPRPEP